MKILRRWVFLWLTVQSFANRYKVFIERNDICLNDFIQGFTNQYISFESASISKIRSLGNFFSSDFAVMNINWLISEFEERISIFDSFCWWANKIVTSRRKSKLLSKNKLRFYLFFDVYSFFFLCLLYNYSTFYCSFYQLFY